MDNQKVLQFNGTAGGYFVVFLVTLISYYIPVFGWAFGFNFMAQWIAENSKVNGKSITYTATYGETLKFIFINTLLLIVTLGIYTFWFVPKSYKYFTDHISEAGAAATPAPAPAAAPEAPVAPSPAAPTDVPTAAATSPSPSEPPKPTIVQ